jgi:hypothetical protein
MHIKHFLYLKAVLRCDIDPFTLNPLLVKKLEYVYFTIYHYCGHQSYFPDSLHVRMKCMYLLALSAGGWILFLQQIFLRFVRMEWFASHAGAMINALSVYTGITVIFYRVFIQEEKDQQIFDKYVERWNKNPNKKRDLLIASLIVAVPYISMVMMKVFLPR